MEVPQGDTYYFTFSTRSFSTGAPTTLAGTPALSVKEEGNDTIITTGVSVDVDTGATPVTGLHEGSVVATSGNGYEIGKYYSVYISTGTVGGVSVVGETVGHFRIMPAEDAGAGIKDVNTTHVSDTSQTANDNGADINTLLTRIVGTLAAGTHNPQTGDSYAIVNSGTFGNAQLVRSTTPANTLDISATGEAGIDWNNVGTPGATVDLSATSFNLVDTATDVTNGVTVTTNNDKTGYSLSQAFPSNFADLAITVTTGQVTVGTNNDKTGYTASTVTDKTGYSISGTSTTLDALNDVAATDIVSAGAITTLTGAVVNVDTVDAVTTTTNLTNAPTSGDLTATMKTSVNSEVSDVLKTDTISEQAQGLPPITPTFEEALMYLYMMLRNKIDVDSGFKEFYNNAGTAIWKKALSDDGSNYVEANGQTGP